MKRLSISTIIGLGIGVLCVISGIYQAGSFRSFYNLPSIFIIIGGTTGAVITSFPPKQLKTLGAVIRKGFRKERVDFSKDIQTIVEISTYARSKGTLALEDLADQYASDPFLRKGILLIADGVSKESLVSSLKTEIYYMKKRHQSGHAMMDMIADSVTSLGLLGTYVGLIPMLEHLEDPASLGPLMAVELVSSFYGAFISYVVFGPLANRLKTMTADEVLRDTLIIEGLAAILEGQNPRAIEERMVSSLTKKQARKMGRRKANRDPIPLNSKGVA